MSGNIEARWLFTLPVTAAADDSASLITNTSGTSSSSPRNTPFQPKHSTCLGPRTVSACVSINFRPFAKPNCSSIPFRQQFKLVRAPVDLCLLPLNSTTTVPGAAEPSPDLSCHCYFFQVPLGLQACLSSLGPGRQVLVVGIFHSGPLFPASLQNFPGKSIRAIQGKTPPRRRRPTPPRTSQADEASPEEACAPYLTHKDHLTSSHFFSKTISLDTTKLRTSPRTDFIKHLKIPLPHLLNTSPPYSR